MIAVACWKCQKKYSLQPEAAGRTAKCSCGSTFIVPSGRIPDPTSVTPRAGMQASVAAPPPLPSDSKPASPAPNGHPQTGQAASQNGKTVGIDAGAYDCFIDPAVLALVRRQVEPESLIGFCDVRKPVTIPVQVMLLTATKLVFLVLERRPGHLGVRSKREMPLGDIDEVHTTPARAFGIGRPSTVLRLVTKSGIESWTSSYASLLKIAQAIPTLKQGGDVAAFIRTTSDLAQLRQTSPPDPAALSKWKRPITVPAFVRRAFIGVAIAVLAVSGGIALDGWLTGPKALPKMAPSAGSNTGTPAPRRTDYAVSSFMDLWRVLGTSSVKDLDSRAIEPVRRFVTQTTIKSFDGKINYIGESTITIFETGAQYPVQQFEVTPVVRMSDTLFMPITCRVSVAKDTEKILAIVPAAMP
jgi:hypothetical protein